MGVCSDLSINIQRLIEPNLKAYLNNCDNLIFFYEFFYNFNQLNKTVAFAQMIW